MTTKVCEWCAGEFIRKSGVSNAQWKKARFCTRACWVAWEKADGILRRSTSQSPAPRTARNRPDTISDPISLRSTTAKRHRRRVELQVQRDWWELRCWAECEVCGRHFIPQGSQQYCRHRSCQDLRTQRRSSVAAVAVAELELGRLIDEQAAELAGIEALSTRSVVGVVSLDAPPEIRGKGSFHDLLEAA